MPRGGARPGAGRPKGSGKNASPKGSKQEAQREAKRLNMTPLEYMQSVFNDPQADPQRRDKMAQAAAPYVHPRAEPKGKKAERDDQAKTAGQDSEWGGDLHPGSSAVN